MGIRKRETERIEKENHAFAKRLFDKQAVLKKKALDRDWASHMKYKNQIAKMSHQPYKSSVFSSQGRKNTAGGYSMQQVQSTPNMQGGQPMEGEDDPNLMQQQMVDQEEP